MTTPSQGKRHRVIKNHCEACTFYEDCPRMRGENVCYGKKVPLSELPPSSQHHSREEEQTHEPQS